VNNRSAKTPGTYLVSGYSLISQVLARASQASDLNCSRICL